MDSKGEDGMTKFQAQYSCGSNFSGHCVMLNNNSFLTLGFYIKKYTLVTCIH